MRTVNIPSLGWKSLGISLKLGLHLYEEHVQIVVEGADLGFLVRPHLYEHPLEYLTGYLGEYLRLSYSLD